MGAFSTLGWLEIAGSTDWELVSCDDAAPLVAVGADFCLGMESMQTRDTQCHTAHLHLLLMKCVPRTEDHTALQHLDKLAWYQLALLYWKNMNLIIRYYNIIMIGLSDTYPCSLS